MSDSPRIAVLLPCHNEQATVAKVVADFRAALPSAEVYVFDNASTDATAAVAADAGATVIPVPQPGKGHVIAAMLERVGADYYVMADGDDTYPADHVAALLEPVTAGRADMVVGARRPADDAEAFRPLHTAGNRLVRRLINWLFGAKLTDILSGFRAFNDRVARTVPVVSSGFEVETELTVQTLYYRLVIAEVPVPYTARPAGSRSKLRTVPDGARVLWKIFSLMRSAKPLTTFGAAGLVLLALGLAAGVAPLHDYITTGEVPHFPRAVLATGLVILSALSVLVGVLLHQLNWRFKELHNVLVRR
ncbi:MAG: glycosyltransferase [Phycisphaerae bacterium]|nr:glycosyltransferase [Phycisphaerae bacterium]